MDEASASSYKKINYLFTSSATGIYHSMLEYGKKSLCFIHIL